MLKVILSFDDGRDDFYNSYLILKKYGLTASFHITTGFIDNTFKTDKFGLNRLPLTVEQIKEMDSNNMDISSHGDKHVMNSIDFYNSYTKLKLWINKPKIGFSIPNSKYSNDELKLFVDENMGILEYVRVGRNKKCYTLINKSMFILYKYFKFQFAYNIFNKNNLISKINPYNLYSVVVKQSDKISSIIKFINKYKSTDKTVIFMFHSIVNNPSNQWEYKVDHFDALCKFLSLLNHKEILITNIHDLIKLQYRSE